MRIHLLFCAFVLVNHFVIADDEGAVKQLAGNDKVAEIMKTFPPRGVQSDGSTPTPAAEAVKLFKMDDGFSIDLVASEPDVSQPLFLSWDSRGRMWVIQYRQYQYPAGLKIVRFDHHLRAVFDKVPLPPPHGAPGKDRITVFEDTDGDGLYDSNKDVITGLNITSSVAIGRGGIWVLNPPYLLFYPDTDGDDVPDAEPEVHLSGFGMQDTHSVANSLMWGPDGWLYGSNGSTTGGTVSSQATKGISFQGQCVWRYNPGTKIFEIYAEGGGNTFSLDIDAKGRVFSGTNGGKTRGLYYPQGSYAHKNWGKHGPLTNPYAFGFFDVMKLEGDPRRFAQAFMIYEGGLFPKEFEGSVIAPNAMLNLVWHSKKLREGSTYRTVDQANLAESSDRWFRPVYGGVGPDGCVYIGDWYDTRLSHVSPTDDWHKESGRVYRIRPTESSPKYTEGDLSKQSSERLIALFDHSNKWVRHRAVLELGWRGDKQVVDQLASLVSESSSLEALWALSMLGELTAERASDWMQNKDPHIRRWAVRLMGDRHEGTDAMVELASRETEVQVRSQLASTARRIDAETGLAVAANLLCRDEDISDPHMPLMNWWAVEGHVEDWDAVRSFLTDETLWSRPMMRATIVERLMQRYAAAGTAEGLERCNELIELAPDVESRELLIVGLNKAFQGRTLPQLPDSLRTALSEYQAARGEAGIVLQVRQGKQESYSEAIKLLRNTSADSGLRIEIARAFGEVHHDPVVDTLLSLALARDHREPALQRVALRSLSLYDDDRVPAKLARAFDSSLSNEHNLRATACRTLASRKSGALALLNELNEWRLKKRDVPADVVQRLRTYQDDEVIAAVNQAFGPPAEISSPEKVAEIKRLSDLLTTRDGNAELGAAHFKKRCANCHRLFGEGETIGPPLDTYDRGNLKFWLPALIAPSLEIREGFQSYLALTVAGRVITGMIAAQDPKSVTIRTADNQKVILQRDDLEELRAIKTSLMPEDVLKEMTDGDIKDLMAYLSLGAK